MKKENTDNIKTWNVNISILKNPLLWFQVFIIAFVVFLFMLVLLVEANLFQYQWEAIPSSFVVAIIIGGVFFSVISLILLVVYIQGIPTTYVLNDKTIEQYTLSKKKKTFSFLSLLGVASGKQKKVFAIFVTLIPIITVVAAFVFEEVDMSRSGSVYALIVELISISFFLSLGIKTLFKRIN